MGGIVSDNLGRASGLVKAGAGGTGKVLQVVGATHATEVDNTATSYTDSGLDVDITPSASSSKIFIYATMGTTWAPGYHYYLTLFRGDDDLTEDDAQGMLSLNMVTGSLTQESSFLFLDSPSSTSELTYSVYGKSETSGQSLKMCAGSAVGSITAIEIDGS